MPMQIPRPGTRTEGSGVRTNEDLQSYNLDRPLPGANQFELLSHCKDKDPEMPQQDDGVTGTNHPMPDVDMKRKQGGPTSRRHKP